MPFNFDVRSAEEEMMDDLKCAGDEVRQTLHELEMINRLLGGNKVTINALSRMVEPYRGRRLSVADLGCGSGEMLRLIRKWSDRNGFDLSLTGIDANAFIVDHARRETPASMNIKYEVKDIFSPDMDLERFDVVIGTLFFHHFTTGQLTEFFAGVRSRVKVGLIVNDIHRHPLAFHSIRWITAGLSKSPMVRNDAPLSVLRAFKRRELVEILQNAGFSTYSIRWMWAFRWQVIAGSQKKMA